MTDGYNDIEYHKLNGATNLPGPDACVNPARQSVNEVVISRPSQVDGLRNSGYTPQKPHIIDLNEPELHTTGSEDQKQEPEPERKHLGCRAYFSVGKPLLRVLEDKNLHNMLKLVIGVGLFSTGLTFLYFFTLARKNGHAHTPIFAIVIESLLLTGLFVGCVRKSGTVLRVCVVVEALISALMFLSIMFSLPYKDLQHLCCGLACVSVLSTVIFYCWYFLKCNKALLLTIFIPALVHYAIFVGCVHFEDMPEWLMHVLIMFTSAGTCATAPFITGWILVCSGQDWKNKYVIFASVYPLCMLLITVLLVIVLWLLAVIVAITVLLSPFFGVYFYQRNSSGFVICMGF